eukprot:scaffold8626_cov225-Isochrysis_galbana.AAC.2
MGGAKDTAVLLLSARFWRVLCEELRCQQRRSRQRRSRGHSGRGDAREARHPRSRATARPRSPTLSASEEPTPVSTTHQGVPPQVNEATSLAPDGERWPAASGARAALQSAICPAPHIGTPELISREWNRCTPSPRYTSSPGIFYCSQPCPPFWPQFHRNSAIRSIASSFEHCDCGGAGDADGEQDQRGDCAAGGASGCASTRSGDAAGCPLRAGVCGASPDADALSGGQAGKHLWQQAAFSMPMFSKDAAVSIFPAGLVTVDTPTVCTWKAETFDDLSTLTDGHPVMYVVPFPRALVPSFPSLATTF